MTKTGAKKLHKLASADTSEVLDDLRAQLELVPKARPKKVGPKGWPLDLPVYLEVERIIYNTEDHNPPKYFSQGALGHILTLDLFTCKSRVTLTILKDPVGFLIDVDGEEVYIWARDPDDLPTKLPEVLAEINGMAGRWAEMANLEVGDFVDEIDGVPVVTKAEPDEDDDPILEPEDDDPILDGDDDVEWE